MTNEQREAIDRLKDDIKYADMRDTVDDDCTICFIDDLDTVLSLIKEQQEEIVKYEKIYKEYDCYRWVKELNKKDKQIDLMAEYISKRDVEEDICMKNKTNPDWCNEDYTNCQDCIKKYFADLVEKE